MFTHSKKEVLEMYNITKEKGLSPKQIQNNYIYGLNEFTPPLKQSFFEKLIDSLKDPMLIILMVAGLIMTCITIFDYFKKGQANFSQCIGVYVAILLSSGVSLIMEGRSEKSFEKLNNTNENTKNRVRRNSKVEYVLKKDITVGDIVILEKGDKIPADGRLIETKNLKINESMLTGESNAVSKNDTKVFKNRHTPLAERLNMVYGGTFVVEGNGIFIVTSIGDKTQMGGIANELKQSVEGETPLQQKLGILGSQISKFGMYAATTIFSVEIIKMFIHKDVCIEKIIEAFMASVALIVAAVPEGLPTMITMTLAINMMKMASNNALVRKMVACETVGCINIICSDKTGTLTKNQMTVMEIWNNNKLQSLRDVKEVPKQLKNNFAINSTAYLKKNNNKIEFIGNPTECSLIVTIPNYEQIRSSVNVVNEYEFSSERKMMSTIIEYNKNGNKMYTKGAPEKILVLCNKISLNGELVTLTDEIKMQISNEIVKLQKNARRVIAFAHKYIDKEIEANNDSDIEKDLIYDGFVGISDPLRKDVYEAVSKCKNAGVELKILTGDNKITANAIAKELNILEEDSLVLETNEIENMTDEELIEKIPRIKVIARSKPTTKMRVVKLLKEKGNVVAVTGDGINDAPALKNADVGIAMGISGTEVSKEASDIILLDDSFTTIQKAIKWGRGIYENFQRFIQFQLTVNIVAFLTAFIAVLIGRPMPFTTLQLLWVNIIMDGPPALSLGLESPREYLMGNKPTKRAANIITKDMKCKIVTNGLFMSIMLLLLLIKKVLGGTIEQQSTIVFTTFVLFQLFNAFNSREFNNDSIFPNLTKNKIMLLIVGIAFLIQILVTQFGSSAFQTVPLGLKMWGKMLSYSLSIIIFSEIVKIIKKIINK